MKNACLYTNLYGRMFNIFFMSFYSEDARMKLNVTHENENIRITANTARTVGRTKVVSEVGMFTLKMRTDIHDAE